MMARLLANTIVFSLCAAAVFCFAAEAAAAQQYMITVLRTSDPVEARELLGQQRPSAGAGSTDLHWNYRTSGYAQRRHGRWQVAVSEGQAAFVAVGRIVPQLQIPWIELTRHGPVPSVDLAERELMDGIYVQARRLQDEVELTLYQFGGHAPTAAMPDSPGTGLRTVLRGKPGRWLDAGGSLPLDDVPETTRGYSVRHHDRHRSRVLFRVDVLD